MTTELQFREMKRFLGMDGLYNDASVLHPTNCILKNGEDGKFYVMSILPQFKNNEKATG